MAEQVVCKQWISLPTSQDFPGSSVHTQTFPVPTANPSWSSMSKPARRISFAGLKRPSPLVARLQCFFNQYSTLSSVNMPLKSFPHELFASSQRWGKEVNESVGEHQLLRWSCVNTTPDAGKKRQVLPTKLWLNTHNILTGRIFLKHSAAAIDHSINTGIPPYVSHPNLIFSAIWK